MNQNSHCNTSLDTTTAEFRIREVAALIDMFDEERIQDILQRLKDEFVNYAWQLPGIDSSQWKELNVPIGLVAGIKELPMTSERPTAVAASSSFVAPSPAKSVNESVLDLMGSSTVFESDAIFEDDEDSIPERDDEDPLLTLPCLPATITDVLGLPDPPRIVSSVNRSEENVVTHAEVSEGEILEGKEEYIKTSEEEGSDFLRTIKSSGSDDSGDKLPSETNTSRRARKREAKLRKVLAIDSPNGSLETTPTRTSPYHAAASPLGGTLSFQEEWYEVQSILRRLPMSDQRAVLCQLLIVANGQTQAIRAKLVENVIVKIREIFGNGPISKDDLDLVIDHLRFFAQLRSEVRKKFGKVLFAALSQLHAPPAIKKDGKSTDQLQTEKTNTPA